MRAWLRVVALTVLLGAASCATVSIRPPNSVLLADNLAALMREDGVHNPDKLAQHLGLRFSRESLQHRPPNPTATWRLAPRPNAFGVVEVDLKDEERSLGAASKYLTLQLDGRVCLTTMALKAAFHPQAFEWTVPGHPGIKVGNYGLATRSGEVAAFEDIAAPTPACLHQITFWTVAPGRR